MSAGIVWLLVLLALLAWWLLPRWAPDFVIRHAPVPDMVFRAAIDGDASTSDASRRLIAMGTRSTPVMVAHLHHSDDKARSLALTVLGEVKDPQATEAVIAVLNDPRESLHALAIKTLGGIGDPRAIPHVLVFLSHKTLSFDAAIALQSLPDSSVADALRPLIDQRQETHVLLALHENKDPRVPGWLDTEMRNETPIITERKGGLIWQELAADLLGGGSLATGRDLLLKAMGDDSPLVRKRGAQGLTFTTQQPLSEAERTAILRLLNDVDVKVIEAAVLVCNCHGIEAAVPSLLQLLDNPDPVIRKGATYGFGIRLFDKQATTRLVTLTTDPDEQVRVGAVNSIGRIAGKPKNEDTDLIPSLIQALDDVSPRVRKAAVYGLNRIKDPQATSGLLKALDDEDSSVREVAFQQLSYYRVMTAEQKTKLEAARIKIERSPR